MKAASGLCVRVVATIIFCCLALNAQQNVGTIVGTVSDPTGAIVPGAKLVLTNQGTNLPQETLTGSSGDYAFRSLPIGRYTLTVSAAGFQSYQRSDIPVVSGETATINVPLVVGATTQTINVTSAALVLDTTSTTEATSRTNREIEALPITLYGNSSRSAIALAKTFAGVSYDPAESGGQEFMVMGRAMINGIPDGEWAYNIDGVDGAVGSGEREHDMQPPTPDMIEEVRVTANSDVSEPFNPGVSVSLTEKSGTNDLHGSLYEYNRNDVVGARQFFLKDVPEDKQNNFGFSLGGPVVIPHVYNGKNKTFFFASWDFYRFRTTLSGVQASIAGSVATPLMRQGNFSEVLGPQVGTDALGRPVFEGEIYDPATTRTLPGGQIVRDPFPGNIIPSGSLSPISSAVISQEALPTIPGVANNWFGPNAQTRVDKDQLHLKFDQIINPTNRLTFAYEKLTPWTLFQKKGVETGFSAHSFINGGPGYLPASGGESAAFIDDRDQYRYRFNYVWSAKPNVLLSFRAGVTGNPNRRISWFPLTGKTATFGGDIGLKGTLAPRGPLVNIQGFSQLGSGFGNQIIPGTNIPANLDVAWTRDRHNFKFGVNYNLLHAIIATSNNNYGTFNFLRQETGLPGFSATGSGMSSFVLGAVDSANVSTPLDQYQVTGGWGFFGQDTWRATHKLTVTYGVRWDLFIPGHEHQNRIGSFDPKLPNPGAGGLPGALSVWGTGPGRNGLTKINDYYYRAWGGQLGLAYALNPKTVLRANGGIGYSAAWVKWTGSAPDSEFPSSGFAASLTSTTVDQGVTPAFYWHTGFPKTFPTLPVTDPALLNGSSLGFVDRSANRPPMYENLSFEVARELPGSVLFRIAYVGNFAHRVPTDSVDNLNALPISDYATYGSLLNSNINSPEAIAAGIPSPYAGFNGSVAQALLPYPQYLSVPVLREPVGNSAYNALQINVQKRLGHGLTFLAAYTNSKTITNFNKVVVGEAFGQLQHPALKGTDRNLAREDAPQILALSWTYDLPFGQGKHFAGKSQGALNKIIGGWQLTGIHNYIAGRTIRVTTEETIPFASLWPESVSGVPLTGNTNCSNFDPGNPADRVLNPNAFRSPPPFAFGNIFTLPNARLCGYKEEDFGLDKQVHVTERLNLRLGTLWQNAFNRHVWRSLNTDINNAAFGRYSDAYPGRNIQFYGRLEF